MDLLARVARTLQDRRRYGPARALIGAALLVAPRDPRLLRGLLDIAVAQRDARAIAGCCRRLLAVRPQERAAREMLAALELAGGRIEEARALVGFGDAASEPPEYEMRLALDSLIDPARARRDGVYVATVRDVLVETADWSILDGERVYNNEAHNRNLRKNPYVAGRASPDDRAFLFRLPRPARTIEARCVHLGGDRNYCHWLMRNLIKLSLLERTPDADAPLLVNEDLMRHQVEYLDLLGIPARRLIGVPRPAVVACRELVVPTSLCNHVRMGEGMRWLRERLREWITPGTPRKLIFVSRRDSRVRRLLNEEEVAAALAPLGFETIVPGEMSVRDQIRTFSAARVVVGAHGAAFGNLMFCPPGARVLEINSTLKAHFPEFPLLAQQMALRFLSVLSEDYEFASPRQYLPDADYRIAPAEVLAALERLAPELTRAGAGSAAG